MNNLGIKIKQLRKESGILQSELGEFTCCSGQVISNIERGYTKPAPEQIAKIAEYFNVPTDYLLGKDDCRWIADSPYSRSDALSKRITERMRYLQIDVSSLAKAAELDEAICSSIISGNTKPNIDTLLKIARSLQTTTDFLSGTTNYAIAVSSEDEQDIILYFRGMDKSHRRRFMGLLEDLKNE
ncbi:helix-turn-helix domain-containing protein [Mediterraneibacter agrestimuris]|uniref:helix-turn-helix domain-containing protein n=1 Tax=Mediterraneibacter agrestimuris TaxID=2941333 RepID=UPI00203F6BD5|nr:helix-turn-helix transcriptional regulator [Mediterraneibacter agrestimuris]